MNKQGLFPAEIESMDFQSDYTVFTATYPYSERNVDGVCIRFRYHAVGEPTLVLLVGASGIPEMFFGQFTGFVKKGYSVLSIDYPAQIRTNDSLADAIAGLLRSLRIEKPVLVGQSYGGFLAQLIAARCTDLSCALVLSNTGTIIEGMDRAGEEELLRLWRRLVQVKRLMKVTPESVMKRTAIHHMQDIIRGVSPEERRAYFSDWLTVMSGLIRKEKGAQMLSLLLNLTQTARPGRSAFHNYHGRCLLLLSEDDGMFGDNTKQALIGQFPSPQVITDLKGGHLSFLLNRDAYLKAVDDFLVTMQ